jgi:hypothetical protein
MEPMSAFEQQLSRVAAEVAGPAKRVDAMAVVCSAQAGPVGRWSVRLRGIVGGATTTTERGFSMFSAVKLVAAGVIVAAFSSFLLLSGVVSPQPVEPVPGMTASPTATASGDVEPSETALPLPATPMPSDPDAWAAVVLPQAEKIAGLATGVAAGPDSIVAVGRRACEHMKNEDIGRCWGQPWISTDGVTWEAVEPRSSGLDLGRFSAVTSGPEVGVEGVAYGPGGYVAYGWARPDGRLTTMLWRSDDGRSWERLPAPAGFETEGLMLPGPWAMAIAGSEDGYLLGGTIYGKPAPRAAIWFSPDGLTWTPTEGDEVFDVGAYIDTMETPAAGGIEAVTLAPSGSTGTWHAVAVGSTCPQGKPGAGPKGVMSRTYDWTTGQCRAQAWHSADGIAWERLDLPKGYFRAESVATDGSQVIVGSTSSENVKEIISSVNGIDWAANGGKAGRQVALAADSTGFRALVPSCVNEGCRRRTLELWSSVDGVTWGLDPAQPTMPDGVEDFMDVDMADYGDHVVVTAGYWTAPRMDLASMAMLSPDLAAPSAPPGSYPEPTPTPERSADRALTGAAPWPSAPLAGAVSVTAHGDRFLAIGTPHGTDTGSRVFTSDDGLAWSEVGLTRKSGVPDPGKAAAFDGDLVVVLGSRGREVTAWRSPDGRSWEQGTVEASRQGQLDASIRDLAAGPRGLLAVGDFIGQDLGAQRLWRSADGLTWQQVLPPAGLDEGVAWVSVSALEDGFLLMGTATSDDPPQLIWRSPDGASWVPTTGPEDGALLDAVAGDDGVVIGLGVDTIWLTRDLLAWDPVYRAARTSDEDRFLAVDRATSGFVATREVYGCADDGQGWCPSALVLVSPDGATWSQASGPDGLPGPDPGLGLFEHGGVASLDDTAILLGDLLQRGRQRAWLLPPVAADSPSEVAATATVPSPLPTREPAPAASATQPPATTGSPSPPEMPTVVLLPPADADPLPETVDMPAGSIAYVAGADTTDPRIRLHVLESGEDSAFVRGTEPEWRPEPGDAAAVAYTTHSSDPRGPLGTIHLKTCGDRECADMVVVRDGSRPRFSADGRYLAFRRSVIDLGDARVRDLDTVQTVRIPGGAPEWSPTGEWLMVTTGSGVPYVTIVRPDGSDERVLGPGWNATWSPDGTRIASAWAGDEGTLVSSMDVATGETAPLFALQGSILSMAWLPGDVMAIVNGGTDGGDLHAVDLADLTVRSLTSGITFLPGSELAVSPDGRWLAFGATASDGTDIFLASVDGGWRRITDQGDASMPTWKPEVAASGSAAPAQGASPLPSAVASPSTAQSPISDDPTAEELVLFSGLRLDLQEACVPLRTDLAEPALAGIECRPLSEDVDQVRVYLFDTQEALLETYLARLVAQGVEPGTASGRCLPGEASEGPYTPWEGDKLEIAERGGCYLDAAGLAHYLATNPPFVLTELDGTTGDMAALEGWAWLGNQDAPGNPTVWREVPVAPSK